MKILAAILVTLACISGAAAAPVVHVCTYGTTDTPEELTRGQAAPQGSKENLRAECWKLVNGVRSNKFVSEGCTKPEGCMPGYEANKLPPRKKEWQCTARSATGTCVRFE